MCFGDAAMRCWSMAAQLLGWRSNEFWSATPAELAASLRTAEPIVNPVPTDLLAELRQRFPD